MEFSRIRGEKTKPRCTDKYDRLYCECGCQIPRIDDFNDSQLNNIKLDWVDLRPMQNIRLGVFRNQKRVGSIDFGKKYLSIDGNEYMGCCGEKWESLKSLKTSSPRPDFDSSAGSTLDETAAQVRQSEKIELTEQENKCKNHMGYCNKCHSFCYGDCEANCNQLREKQ